MNLLEYATVTSAIKDDVKGAQLINAKGNLTGKKYTKVELLSFRGVTALPKAGDTIIMLTVCQGQYMAIGVLEQQDVGVEEGEVLLHFQDVKEKGPIKEYLTRVQLKITKDYKLEINTIDENKKKRGRIIIDSDNSIKLETLDSNEISKASLKLDQNGALNIVTASTININSTGNVTVTAPSVLLP